MYKYSISVLWFLALSFLWGQNHYVDKNASGSNNGTSWVNAWQSFSAIDWNSVQPGDTIFISGGQDSTIYYEQMTVGRSGSAGNWIVITKGKSGGHNGEVIIDGQNSRSYCFYVSGRSYIKVEYMTMRYATSRVARAYTGSQHITFSHLTIHNTLGYCGINVWHAGNIIIEYCYIDNIANNGGNIDNDVLTINGNLDATSNNKNFIIRYNQLHQRSTSDGDHSDIIQMYYCEDVQIYGNYCVYYYNKAGGGTNNSSGFYLNGGDSGNWWIYNNVIIHRSTNTINNAINLIGDADVRSHIDSAFIYNNSILLFGNQRGIFVDMRNGNSPSQYIEIKNNAIYHKNSAQLMSLYSGNTTWNVDYNISRGASSTYYLDGTKSWSAWQSAGCDAHGLNQYPSYVSTTYENEDLTSTVGGNLIDNGTPTSIFNEDILGISRPQGSAWDVGAYEYTTGGGGGNNPPNQPSNPNPSNGAIDQPINLVLTWSCTDPDGDPLIYDVYFGTSNNPPLVSSNQSNASFNPGQLNNNTTYYWKIVAKDNQGATTSGPVWNFTTEAAGGGNNPPNQPSNPNPSNNAIDQQINLVLTWSCTDPDGDPLTYDVYFGTSNNPSLVSSNQSNASFNPGQLNNNTTYYWKIVAKDNQGATTSGPVWNFTTLATGGDVTPPELIGVQIVESDQVVLDFSEPMDESQVNNLGNYSISEQIQVLNAELSQTQQRIILTTDQHTLNHIYTIVINNLTDLAGNVISPQANSTFYKELDIGSAGYLEHLIENVSASETSDTNTSPQKTLDGLVNGDPDPNSRWAAQVMPQWIQYDLGAIQNINLIAISFYQWNSGRIFQYSIQVSNDENNWNEIISNATSSNQEWTLNEFSSLSYRYVRIICLSNNINNWACVWEARIFEPDYPTSTESSPGPQNYVLEQNYPNPFNPSTKLRYYLPSEGSVSIKLYDIIGNEISTLVNEISDVGYHEIELNGSNLAGGIYFYQMTVGNFVETRKMVLLK